MLELATHRPVLGPNTMRAADTALSALEGLGLDDLEMDRVFNLIASYVAGAVRDAAREKTVNQQTGMTDNEWWRCVEPYLNTIDFSPYPVLSRVGQKTGETYGAHDPMGAFNFGLERVLDGLALFIEPKRKAAPGQGMTEPKRIKRDISGWLILDKPLGMTSTQAVGKVRWLFGAKKGGHAGTLDPLATGILPIALGEATKTVPLGAGRHQDLSLRGHLGRRDRNRGCRGRRDARGPMSARRRRRSAPRCRASPASSCRPRRPTPPSRSAASAPTISRAPARR